MIGIRSWEERFSFKMRKSFAPSRKQSKDNAASQAGSVNADKMQETQQALINSMKFVVWKSHESGNKKIQQLTTSRE